MKIEVVLTSSQINREKRIVQTVDFRPSISSEETTSQSVDPRPVVMKQNRYFLTLDRS